MKTSEVREMSVADLKDRIQVEKNRLDTMRMITILAEKEKDQK